VGSDAEKLRDDQLLLALPALSLAYLFGVVGAPLSWFW
jgi:hypothetical protein